VSSRPTAHRAALLHRFLAAERGNVAAIFAIALLPILAFIGAAVDYSRTSNARTAMQAALDSAALMVAKDFANGTVTSGNLATTARNYFDAMYVGRPDATTTAFTVTYTANTGSGSTVKLTGAGSLPTTFARVMGFNTMTFNTASTATWGNTKLRVALVLDNTGSMGQNGKIEALRSAASNLVDQLSASAVNNGDVYISVIPFAKDVNVGSTNYNATWLDWSDWDSANKNCSWTWWGYSCTARSHSTWTGCVTDRDQNYDTTNTAPTSSSTRFPTEEYYENGYYYCSPNSSVQLQQVIPLSYNWTALKSAISAMVPTGGTNQAIGLHWGWMSLTQSAPLNAPALDSSYKYVQAIILLSDGLNTEDRWYGDGTSWSAQVDARQQILCDNIKAAGITIYSIQVNTSGDPQSSVLAYCASGSGNFFYLTSADQVLSTFSTIGAQLTKLRISK
jgi:Flp pilus assembly protein TadG